MITINELTKELETRGYIVKMQDVVKNGVRLTGLTLRSTSQERIAPCIYIDRMLEEFSDPVSAADTVENTIASARTIDINPDGIITRDNILKNAHIALQRASEQELVKRQSALEDIEEYVFIQGDTMPDNIWSVKLLPIHLSMADITEEEAWAAAERNTFNSEEISINTMQSILSELTNMDVFPDVEVPMYVISNRRKHNGAVQIFNHEAIKKWADEHGFKRLVMLPSSLHEVIVIPADENNIDLEELSNMVQDVNDTQVAPTDQLGDRAYIIDISVSDEGAA